MIGDRIQERTSIPTRRAEREALAATFADWGIASGIRMPTVPAIVAKATGQNLTGVAGRVSFAWRWPRRTYPSGVETNGWATYLRRNGMRKDVKGEAMAKNTICLWYDKDAEAAARFYAETFPGSAVGAVHRAPSDYPSGKQGDVLTVEFTVAGIPCLGLNGGPAFRHSEAFSFQIVTE